MKTEIKSGDVYRTEFAGKDYEYMYDPDGSDTPWVCISGDERLRVLREVSEYRYTEEDIRGRIAGGEAVYSYSISTT